MKALLLSIFLGLALFPMSAQAVTSTDISGGVIVSIPDEIDLSYNANSFSGSDVVTVEISDSSVNAEGCVVSVLVDTIVPYNHSYNMETVEGTVIFGIDGLGEWVGSEITDGVSKDLSITLNAMPKYIGDYTGNINFCIYMTGEVIPKEDVAVVSISDGDISDGNIPEEPVPSVSDGDISGGDIPVEDVSGGDVSDGDIVDSEASVSDGDVSSGDVSGGDIPEEDVSSGDLSGDTVSSGDPPVEDVPAVSDGNVSSGDVSGGDIPVSSGDIMVSSGDVILTS